MSTISTALGVAKTPGSLVPETIIRNFAAPEPIGYGESKYVSELLIEDFAKTSGVATTVFRTGQIAGPLSKRGVWNKQEWFPSIVASSKHLNVLPESLASFENIDWVPVDLLSTIMVELVDPSKSCRRDTCLQSSKSQSYFLVKPAAGSQGPYRYFSDTSVGGWVDELARSVRENHGIIVTDKTPAAKLLLNCSISSGGSVVRRRHRQVYLR